MINEYENDDGDEGYLLNIQPFVLNGDSGDSGDSTPSMANAYATRIDELDEATREALMRAVDYVRYINDSVISRISDDPNNIDEEGYLSPEFVVRAENIGDVGGGTYDNEGRYGNIATVGNGGVGVYINKVQDSLTMGGEFFNGSFTLYAPLQAFSTLYPAFTQTSTALTEVESTDSSGDTYVQTVGESAHYSVTYTENERAGFNEKYAKLPGLQPFGESGGESPQIFMNLSDTLYEELERQFSAMAAEVYQTTISREYIPQVISNDVTFTRSDLKTSIGTELSDPLVIRTTPSDSTMGSMGGMGGSSGGSGGSGGYS